MAALAAPATGTNYHQVNQWRISSLSTNIEAAPNGDIYAVGSQTSRSPIEVWDQFGTLKFAWSANISPARTVFAHDIAFDGLGTAYVNYAETPGEIERFTLRGERLGRVPGPSHYEHDGHAIAADAAGNLYTAGSNVIKRSLTGAILAQWSTLSTDYAADGYQLAVDPYGYVYLGDTDANKLLKFTGAGSLVASWPMFGGEIEAGPNGSIYLYDDDVVEYSASGRLISRFDPPGKGGSLAVGPNGNVYVTGDPDQSVNGSTNIYAYASSPGPACKKGRKLKKGRCVKKKKKGKKKKRKRKKK